MRRLLSGLIIVGVLIGAFGCATTGTGVPIDPRAGDAQAIDIIWHEVYGRTDRPPLVRWVRKPDLPCTDETSGKPGFVIPDTDENGNLVVHCREGFTWSPLEILVADHGELSMGETAAPHELWHVVLLREGDWMPGHADTGFYHPDECAAAGLPSDRGRCAIVDRAIGAVELAGR